MLYVELVPLETKSKELQKAESEILKPNIVNEHANWYLPCHQTITNTFERWTSANLVLDWASENVFCNFKDKVNFAAFCRIEHRIRQQQEMLKQQSGLIEGYNGKN